jgi:hypothetical protein
MTPLFKNNQNTSFRGSINRKKLLRGINGSETPQILDKDVQFVEIWNAMQDIQTVQLISMPLTFNQNILNILYAKCNIKRCVGC